MLQRQHEPRTREPLPTFEGGGFVVDLEDKAALWEILDAEFARRDRQVRANLVPDAYLAALAISHGCRLATADRGFGRFPGLDFFDPTA